MYYSLKEREDIGKKVFTHQLTKEEAMKEYDRAITTVINYVKYYMQQHNIPVVPKVNDILDIEMPNYQEMSKDELITELMRKDVEIARTKKGYTVKANYSEFNNYLQNISNHAENSQLNWLFIYKLNNYFVGSMYFWFLRTV